MAAMALHVAAMRADTSRVLIRRMRVISIGISFDQAVRTRAGWEHCLTGMPPWRRPIGRNGADPVSPELG